MTIVERSSGASPHGDSVILGSNAARLLGRWGVGEEMWQRSSRGRWWVVKDSTGRTVHKEDLGALPAQYGAPILQGKRSHFLGAMGTEARMLGVKFRYGAEVVGYDDSSDRPAAILANEEIVRADTIIICDGVNSSARTLLPKGLEQPASFRRTSGYSIHRAIIDSTRLEQDPECQHLLDGNIRFWLGSDAHVAIYPMDHGRQIAFTYTHRDDDTSTLNWRSSVCISTVLAQLTDWDPTLQRALSHFRRALHWTILEGGVQDNWISKGGKIAFAGDAVHPLIPTSFQGASQSIEDGATLAICLAMAGGTNGQVGLALRAYEKMRIPRTQAAARLGRKQQTIYHTFTSRQLSPSPKYNGSPDPGAPVTARQRRPSPPSPPSPPPLATATSGNGIDEDSSDPPSQFAPSPRILQPLAFATYDFDAERYATESWASIVHEIEAEDEQSSASSTVVEARPKSSPRPDGDVKTDGRLRQVVNKHVKLTTEHLATLTV